MIKNIALESTFIFEDERNNENWYATNIDETSVPYYTNN